MKNLFLLFALIAFALIQGINAQETYVQVYPVKNTEIVKFLDYLDKNFECPSFHKNSEGDSIIFEHNLICCSNRISFKFSNGTYTHFSYKSYNNGTWCFDNLLDKETFEKMGEEEFLKRTDWIIPKKFEITPYVGLMNCYSNTYESFLENETFNAVRGGVFTSWALTSKLSFKMDLGGEWNDSKSFALNSAFFEFGDASKQGFKLKIGHSATPVTCFRPHPLSIASQAEYVSKKVLPGGAYHTTLNYSFKNGLFLTTAVAERGAFAGDSTEYSFILGKNKYKFGVYALDGNFGAILNLEITNNTLWVSYKEDLYSGYVEKILGKNNNLLFALDCIYDAEENQTTFTSENNLFCEAIFLYLFDYKKLNLSNGGVGLGITETGINIYFFTRIL